MAPFGAPLQFDGIAPSALPYNLLSVARIEPAADQRFENGIGYYAYPCGPAKKFDQCATVVVPKTTSTTTAATDFGGFTVYLASACTMRGVGNDDDEFKRRALASFEAFEPAQVEAEFWDGAIQPNNPHLTTAAPTLPNGATTTNAVNGLALLEGVLQRDGVIHATRRMVTAWIAARVINDDEGDGVLRTYLGTPVVAGGGYSGAPPSGQPANAGTVEWAYVTTMPSIFRGPAFVTPDTVAEALDRSVNTLTFYAERQYVVAFDQCVRAAVRIDRNQTAA
jgi:hypothetical protein